MATINCLFSFLGELSLEVTIFGKSTFTFMHLADAFIQSDLQCRVLFQDQQKVKSLSCLAL